MMQKINKTTRELHIIIIQCLPLKKQLLPERARWKTSALGWCCDISTEAKRITFLVKFSMHDQ